MLCQYYMYPLVQEGITYYEEDLKGVSAGRGCAPSHMERKADDNLWTKALNLSSKLMVHGYQG